MLTDLERRPVLAVLNGVRFVVWHIIGRPRVLPKNALVAERRTVVVSARRRCVRSIAPAPQIVAVLQADMGVARSFPAPCPMTPLGVDVRAVEVRAPGSSKARITVAGSPTHRHFTKTGTTC